MLPSFQVHLFLLLSQESIFDGEGEKPKKTKVKKKKKSEPKDLSMFEENAPSIFDDPLSALGK